MNNSEAQNEQTPSQMIANQIAALTDWRKERYVHLRDLINSTVPELAVEWKWGTAVWSRQGNVVALGVFKDHLKLNFFRGAELPDPHHLFNAGLEAKASRGIDILEQSAIDESALRDLLRAAAAPKAAPEKKK